MVSAAVLTRRLVVVAAEPVEAVSSWARRRQAATGWPTCDVCRWPVHPVGQAPDRPGRHAGCVCHVCRAPLASIAAGVLAHPQCDPTSTGPVRTARARRRLALIPGGSR